MNKNKTNDVIKLIQFVNGVAGSATLLNRAAENGSFIESVCIHANLIDASLRIGIILKTQLEENNDKVIGELLYQGPKDKIVTEKDIYRSALNKNVIGKIIFKQLFKLYEERNKVVHRYIISKLTTSDVLEIAIKYEALLNKIRKIIAELEIKQIKSGIGMTVARPEHLKNVDVKKNIAEMAKTKHGNLNPKFHLSHI